MRSIAERGVATTAATRPTGDDRQCKATDCVAVRSASASHHRSLYREQSVATHSAVDNL